MPKQARGFKKGVAVKYHRSRLNYIWDGFPPLIETATGEVSGTIARPYDNNFWLNSLSVNGTSVTFGYDNDGLLTRAGSLSLSRDAANGLLPGTALGPVETEQTHNAFGELETETVIVGGEPVLTTTYTRDKLGRITEKRETTGGTTKTYAYGYDTTGRLETVKTNGLTTATYTYDENGNRLRKTTPNRMEEEPMTPRTGWSRMPEPAMNTLKTVNLKPKQKTVLRPATRTTPSATCSR
ncbi:hypothetical protein [Thiohalomonas denitrificans]|uniref:hypothetical protein n=1 Tax=Thiohalomonas denitrificans TaxID=415747 RepID=UPI0026E99D98|nr:hypothetical protein [Thiohalomonas denitrificans]